MGFFYFTHSVALVEDLPLEDHYPTPNEFYAAADKAYDQVSERFFSILLSFTNNSIFIRFSFYLRLECIQLLDSCMFVCAHIGDFGSTILRQQPNDCLKFMQTHMGMNHFDATTTSNHHHHRSESQRKVFS